MNNLFKKILEKRLKILLILWLALLASTGMIAFISYIRTKNYIPIQTVSELLLSPLGLGLIAVSGVMFVFSMSIINLLIKSMTPLPDNKEDLISLIKAVQAKNGKTLSQDEEKLLNELSLNDLKLFRLFISYMILFIIRLALAEGITVMGLQASILLQSFQIIFPFLALSLVVFLSKKPTLETIYNDLQMILKRHPHEKK